jgi:acyl-CoA synthetase (AMP-forming)/AMP-acid ligase II
MSFLGLAPSGAVALVDPATGERLTYRDLVRRGREIAGTFGPEKQVVFLVARNDAFSAVSYWGALDAGHAVALLDGHAAMETTASLVDVFRPTWVAGPAGLGEQMAALGADIGATTEVAGSELVRTSVSGRRDVHPDLGLMLTTSGTTGSRKLVRLSIPGSRPLLTAAGDAGSLDQTAVSTLASPDPASVASALDRGREIVADHGDEAGRSKRSASMPTLQG